MSGTSKELHGRIWRWHFYAGLLVAPFLIVLSLTGVIYLFDREINDALQRDLRFASSPSAPPAPGRLIAAAEAAFPGGRVTRIDMPETPDRTAQLFLTTAEGQARRVFVDPPTGRVLGSHIYTETLVGFADVMHGSLLLGDAGDAIVELAASWTVILVCSGMFLWWPRGAARAGTWFPRLWLRRRPLWRDLHKFAGLYTAILILFLVISGLPWATIWGGRLLAPAANSLGVGYPEGARRPLLSTSGPVAAVMSDAPWTLHHAPMPTSAPHACDAALTDDSRGGCGHPAPIGVDAAAEVLARAGMTEGYRLSLPRGATGVYMAVAYPDHPEGQRTLHVDQYSGEVLADIRFGDYGAVAKAVEWGVAIHMGNYFGRANQILMLLACIGIIGLVATGIGMWWKRRPRGRIGAPPRPADRGINLRLLAVVTVLGIVFPLAGISMLVVWIADSAIMRLRRKRGSAPVGQ